MIIQECKRVVVLLHPGMSSNGFPAPIAFMDTEPDFELRIKTFSDAVKVYDGPPNGADSTTSKIDELERRIARIEKMQGFIE